MGKRIAADGFAPVAMTKPFRLRRQKGGDVRVYTVSVNGNQFTIIGDTYRRGTVEDGFAELAKIFKPSQPDDTTPEP